MVILHGYVEQPEGIAIVWLTCFIFATASTLAGSCRSRSSITGMSSPIQCQTDALAGLGCMAAPFHTCRFIEHCSKHVHIVLRCSQVSKASVSRYLEIAVIHKELEPDEFVVK